MVDKGIYGIFKRALDVIFSFLLLFFLLFPMLLIGVVIRLTSDGDVIFKQRRVGIDGKVFICYKFRTMYKDAPNNRPTSTFFDAQKYITPIGRILRKTSLDELPQLFNVLRGDMSLVGPRPLIENEDEIHAIRARCGVYRVRPGITGLAQVSGRDLLDNIDKVRLDIEYAKKMSFSEDARILMKTVAGAVRGKDVVG